MYCDNFEWFKGLNICLCCLCIVSASSAAPILPAGHNGQSCYTGIVLYVGGGGPGNYSTIQQAIDNASVGNTIYVL